MKKQFREAEQIKRIMLISANTKPEAIDKRYQVLLKELKENPESKDLDVLNQMVKTDVLNLFMLYKEHQISYVDMYNLIIKIIGYDFMYNELINRVENDKE